MFLRDFGSTRSITFGESTVVKGYSVEELEEISKRFKNTEIVRLNDILDSKIRNKYKPEEAGILVIRNGVDQIMGRKCSDQMWKEQSKTPYQKKIKLRGETFQRKSRWTCYFYDEEGEQGLQNTEQTKENNRYFKFSSGDGRIDINEAPLLKELKHKFVKWFGDKSKGTYCFVNHYFDRSKCGIGYHGDTERKIVICVRLGNRLPVCHRWYLNGKRASKRNVLYLNHGDIYIMSEKATGNDWHDRSIPTIRHAAGCDKYIK